MSDSHVGSETGQPRSRFMFWVGGVFLLALLIRSIHLWQFWNSGFFELLFGDARRYHDWALTIAGGNWLGNEVFYQAPLYPYFLGLIYSVFGESLVAARIVQALLGAVSCVLIATAGRRLFSARAGIVSGFILAVYAPAIFLDSLIQKSTLDLFLLCLLIWFVGRLVVRPSRLSCVWLGMVLAGLALTRENALAFVPAILVWLLVYFWKDRKRAFAYGAVFLIGVGLLLLPVAFRNEAVGNEFHLTTAQFGPNFYIGNNPRADGTYKPLLYGRGSAAYEQSDATLLAERALGRKLTPAEVSRYWADEAFDFIRSDTAAWFRLLGRKFLLTWNATEQADSEDPYTYADWSLPLRITNSFGHLGVIAPLAMLGLIVTWQYRRKLWILYLLMAIYFFSLILFFVFGRYRFPLVLFLVLFAGAGLAGIPSLIKGKRLRTIVAGCAVLVAMAVLSNWTMVSKDLMRAVTHSNLGNALWRLGDVNAAEHHYQQSTSAYPRYAKGHYHLGLARESQGRYLEAATSYRTAVRLGPEYAEAHFSLAGLEVRLGNVEAAIDHYQTALRLQPDSEHIRRNLAAVLISHDRLDEARELYDSLLRDNSDDAEALNGLGALLAKQGRYEEALIHYKRAIEIKPNYADAFKNLRIAYEELGRADEAVELLQNAIDADPGSVQAHLSMGTSFQNQGKFAQAESSFREALQIDPNSAEAHNGLGAALASQGKLDAAIEVYSIATGIRDDFALAHYNLANAHRSKGNVNEMIEALRKAVKANPDFVEALTNLGLALSMQGQHEEALEYLHRVVTLKPELAAGHRSLANALFSNRQLDEALTYYERALELEPDSPAALKQVAWILATHQNPQIRNPNRAVSLAERASTLTQEQDTLILDTLSVTYAAAGRFDEAIATAQRALGLATKAGDERLVGQIQQRIAQFRNLMENSR